MTVADESGSASVCAVAEWRVEAHRALVGLWRRRGVVALEDVESVLPEGVAEQDVRELLADLSADGVIVTVEDGERDASGGASLVTRYYRDIGRGRLLGPDGERLLAGRFRHGVLRSVRALSRTVAGASAAVSACRAVLDGRRPAVEFLTDAAGKRGSAVLAAAVRRAGAAVVACVVAERRAACRRSDGGTVVCGRERVRMSQAVQALGLSLSGVEVMAAAVSDRLRALARGRSPVLLRGGCPPVSSPAVPDSVELLGAARRRSRSGRVAAESARLTLIKMNLRFVIASAKRMYRPDLGVPFSDLIQEGNLGLMKAVERFDPRRGRFTTYAAWWIRQSMRRAITETGRTVRIPVHMQEQLAEVAAIESVLLRERGSLPGAAEVARQMGVDADVVRRLRTMPRHAMSLDAPAWVSDEECDTLGERLADPHAEDPACRTRAREFRKALESVMRAELRGDEQAALCRRFGMAELEDPDGGRKLRKLSRERVRRLEVRALRKLQASQHVERLREFLSADADFVQAAGR